MRKPALLGLVVAATALATASASVAAGGAIAPAASATSRLDREALIAQQPEAGQQQQVGQTATATPTPTASDSVNYLIQRYRITPAEAQRRLRLQAEAEVLDAQLAADHPAEYAGMWIDQAGGGVLRVGMTRPSLVPPRAGVVAVQMTRSLRDLQAEAAQLGVAAVDPANNRVIVERRADEFHQKCDPLHCAKAPIRGGVRLDIPRDDNSVGGCTVGYRVRSKVTAKEYVLTAGHCVVGGRHTHTDQTWHEYLSPFAAAVTTEDADTRLAENTWQSGWDYALMPFQTANAENFWLGTETGRRWPVPAHLVNQNDLKITGFTPKASVVVGTVVCASGSGYTPEPGETYVDSGAGAGYVPGTHCGEVVAGSDGANIFVKICARDGDSGGPLFNEATGKALGILSGGDERDGPCVAGDTETNRYAPISTILTRLNDRTGNAFQFELAPQPVAGQLPPRRP